MNVYDWLQNLPFSDPETDCRVVEISFNNGSRKDYFRNPYLHRFDKGEMVTVEGVSGVDVGEVSLSGELVRLQLKKRGIVESSPELRKILRRSSPVDLDRWKENKSREKEVLVRSRAMARQLKLNMKIAEVEIQADGRKATFFYTADERVDFRELIKHFATEFRVKVEMKQIGARQEAGKVGGIGSCGRELCCSTWLTDFKSVNTQAARYQNLSINQAKLSGQCGRLKCCLNYELDTYMDALQHFPEQVDAFETRLGKAFLVKKDIFRNLMWYQLQGSTRQYPLTIQRVKEIKEMAKRGEVVADLQVAEVVSTKAIEKEPEFVDVVGQISLNSLDKKERKQRHKPRRDQPDNRKADSSNQPKHQQNNNQRNKRRNKPKNKGNNSGQ